MADSDTFSPSQPSPAEASPGSGKRAFLWSRLKPHFWLKQWGTFAIMTGFFVLYFTVLNNPVFPVTLMPLTPVDRWIGFQPAALVFYVSLWIYVPLLPSLMTDRRELWRYAAAVGVMSFIGLGIFVLWPTTIPRPDIDWSQHPSLAFLKTIDASGNACPSLHVAFAVFTALGLDCLLRRLGSGRLLRFANFFWGAGIVYSTLATKQHVALDALGGLVLGTTVAAGFFFKHRLVSVVIVTKLSAVLLWLAGLPLPWAVVLFLLTDGPVFYTLFIPGSQCFFPVATRFQTDRPEVWLTIDDGPDEHDTPLILDLLDRHQAKATFFVIGELAARHPYLVAEIQRRGHEIGHHTHTHPLAFFWLSPPSCVHRELDDAFAALARAGVRPSRFRTPAGIKNPYLAPALESRGLTCIAWNLRSGDAFARDPEPVVNRVMKRVRPGDIILAHEGDRLHPRVRVAALTRLLDALSARGLRCVVPTAEQLR